MYLVIWYSYWPSSSEFIYSFKIIFLYSYLTQKWNYKKTEGVYNLAKFRIFLLARLLCTLSSLMPSVYNFCLLQ